MKNIMHKTKWLPDYVADTILDINAKTLQSLGITHIVFDLDNTLVQRGSNELSSQYLAHISKLADNGLVVLLGTNTKRDITDLATLIHATAIQPTGLSYKPFRSFYKRIISRARTDPMHIAMVGDHILNDTYGANRAGLTTIMVNAMHNQPSLLYRRYMRAVVLRS